MSTGFGIDQLYIGLNPLAHPTNAAFEHIRNCRHLRPAYNRDDHPSPTTMHPATRPSRLEWLFLPLSDLRRSFASGPFISTRPRPGAMEECPRHLRGKLFEHPHRAPRCAGWPHGLLTNRKCETAIRA